MIVATHTDKREFRGGLDILPEMSEALNVQFAPKIKVHVNCFKVDYSKPDGGGLATLKHTLKTLRDGDSSKQLVEYPASYARVFAALKTKADNNPEQSVMPMEDVARLIAAESTEVADDAHFADVVMKTLELFGMIKRLG